MFELNANDYFIFICLNKLIINDEQPLTAPCSKCWKSSDVMNRVHDINGEHSSRYQAELFPPLPMIYFS